MGTHDHRGGGLSWVALFASTGTLVCCALPILLVSLGAGATVAALTSALPMLVTLSHYKLWVFGISGLLLAVAAWLSWRPGRSCPAEPELDVVCTRTRRWNRWVLSVAIAVWSLGFFSAFLLYPLVLWWDGA